MRSLLSYIMLHGLLAVSILSVLPWELMSNQQQDQISFFEGENEKEKEKESEKEDAEENKRNKTEKKYNKFLCSVRIVSLVLHDHSLQSFNLKFEWESPILAVLSPPPEEILA